MASETITITRADLEAYMAAKSKLAKVRKQIADLDKQIVEKRAKLDPAILALFEPSQEEPEEEESGKLNSEQRGQLTTLILAILKDAKKGLSASDLETKLREQSPFPFKRTSLGSIMRKLRDDDKSVKMTGKKKQAIWHAAK